MNDGVCERLFVMLRVCVWEAVIVPLWLRDGVMLPVSEPLGVPVPLGVPLPVCERVRSCDGL